MSNQNDVTSKHLDTPRGPNWDGDKYRDIRQDVGLPSGFEPAKHRKKAKRKTRHDLTHEDFPVGAHLVTVIKDAKGIMSYLYGPIIDSSEYGVFIAIEKVEHESDKDKIGHIFNIELEFFEDRKSSHFYMSYYRQYGYLYPTELTKGKVAWTE